MTDSPLPAPRRRGRPVSIASRNAVLIAATKLLDERGLSGFSVDEVARRSGVSKSTIYKHWPGGLPIAVEAYGARVTETIPVSFSGNPAADLISQVRRVAEVYASPRGRVIAQLLGAGAAVEGGAEMVRDGFFGDRRSESQELIQQGVDSGLWDPDVDPENIIELIFGPIVFRALNGNEPFSPDAAAQLASVALRGLMNPVSPVTLRIDHCAVGVSDWNTANAFWRDVMGAEILAMPRGLWAYRFGDQLIAVHGPGSEPQPSPAVAPGSSHVAFTWNGSAADATAHLIRHGVTVELGPIERRLVGRPDGGESVYFRDPDGSVLEFVCDADAPSPDKS